MAGGEHSRRRRLSRSVFSQRFVSRDISQTGINIEDPSGENVHDMDEHNISKYSLDPTVEGGVITVGMFAINMYSI
jgi:hypothetical protein